MSSSPLTDAAIERLSALFPKGFDLSLERVTRLLERLGNPHTRLPPVIHIAGTNGKGSASAFARALLEASGKSVHVHTSPHLVSWRERYRMGRPGRGQLVDDMTLADAIGRVAEANAGEAITVFEILTAAMFLLFSEHPADAAIIEVGLGGRFDATNVIARPAVSLIMPVSLDHTMHLGDRVELIAAEKAGIIKRGCPAVIGQQPFAEAREVLVETAERLGAPAVVYGQDFVAYEEHGRLVVQDEDGLYDLPLPRLPGRHQYANAAAAIAAVKAAGFGVSQATAEKAMLAVEWPARMQRLANGRLIGLAPNGAEIWLDGGHNPGAGLAIAEALTELEERNPRPLVLIAGMINTKDQRGYFEAFAGIARRVYTVPVGSSESGVPADLLAAQAEAAGLAAEPVASVENALRLLNDGWSEEAPPRILIGGSLYLAGEVLAANGTEPD
jgi:dihydrofolate synthase/folylpolyglutamate synthase